MNVETRIAKYALYNAALRGNYREALRLIKLGADVNESVLSGKTPLYVAAEGGHKRITRALLAAGANVNPKMPLQDICFEDALALIKKGVKPNLISPLSAATEGGHRLVMKILLEHGATVHQLSPLGEALKNQTSSILLYNRSSRFNLSAMHIAAAKGNVKAMTLLLKHGAKVDASAAGFSFYYPDYIPITLPWRFHSCTPLHAAAHAGKIHAAKFLLAKGADLHQASYSGKIYGHTDKGLTALHFAAAAGHNEMVDLLLDHGAEIDEVGVDASFTEANDWKYSGGGTALYFAALNGHDETVKLLLSRGANPNISGDPLIYCRYPLHIAAASGHTYVMRELLNHGVSPDQKFGCFPWTHAPLTSAIKANKTSSVELLLEKNAQVTEKMIEKARGRGYAEILHKLEHAYKIQQANIKDDPNDFAHHYAFTNLKAIPLDKLDEKIALFKRIDALRNIALTVKVKHPHASKMASNAALASKVNEATFYFADTLDEKQVIKLEQEALAVSKAAKEGHARDGFFGRHGITRCTLEKKIEEAFRHSPQ